MFPRHSTKSRFGSLQRVCAPMSTRTLEEVLNHRWGCEPTLEALDAWMDAQGLVLSLPLRSSTSLLRPDACHSALQARVEQCILIRAKDKAAADTDPWHVQCHNSVAILLGGRWKVLYAMPRGPEFIPEQLCTTVAPAWSPIGRFVTSSLGTDRRRLSCVLSAKKDGLCWRLMALKRGTPECCWWEETLSLLRLPAFTRTFLEQQQSDVLFIPASKTTVVLTDTYVIRWFMCALAQQEKGDVAEDLHIGAFCARLATLRLEHSGFIYLEAIGGPCRLCALDTRPRAELTVSESTTGVYFLGYSDGARWVHHTDVPATKKAALALLEPESHQLPFQECLPFMKRHTARLQRGEAVSSAEGFFVQVRRDEEARTVYFKMKTWVYHMFHQLNRCKLSELAATPLADELERYFPAMAAVRFFRDTEVPTKWLRCFLQTMVMDTKLHETMPPSVQAALQQSRTDVHRLAILRRHAQLCHIHEAGVALCAPDGFAFLPGSDTASIVLALLRRPGYGLFRLAMHLMCDSV